MYDFYPRSPCGERRQRSAMRSSVHPFLSTLSLRRATVKGPGIQVLFDISIHALLAESDGFHKINCQLMVISIHALLAESDFDDRVALIPHQHFYPRSPCGERRQGGLFQCRDTGISIHALLAESDGRRPRGPFRLMLFLSTLSLRRATCSFCPADSQGRHFYPRSPCGERPIGPQVIADRVGISIHALLAESD